MPTALLNFRFGTGVRSVGILVFLIAGAFSSQLQATQSIEQQRQLFRDASVALARNQTTRFNRLLTQLGDHPAAPYLKYDAFKRNANRVKASHAETFFKHYAEFPFVYHASAKWL